MRQPKKSIYIQLVKPLLDYTLASILVVLLIPVFLYITVLILFTMGTPVFFTQPRITKNNRTFRMIKFRTMLNTCDCHGNLLPDHLRLTRLGSTLRKYSLDELPELFNVLKGDMSLIGPRPLLAEYLTLYNDSQIKRHLVKTGITGWAQINGRNTITWNEKFDLDTYYVSKVCFSLDVKILYLTIKKTLHADGINQGTNTTMEKFKG